jgi:type IV secretion system protein VirD4
MTAKSAPPRAADGLVLAAAAAAALLAAWVWASGEVAGYVSSGRWMTGRVAALAIVLSRLPDHVADPKLAWPASQRPYLPGPVLMYVCAAVLLLPCTAITVVIWRRSSRRPARHVTGARWANGRDLGPVRARGAKTRSRLVLGRPARRSPRGGLIATEARHSVLVIGPTQSGKSSALAIPALLEWRGPVIATSVKDDLCSATYRWRSRLAEAWVFDPTGSSGAADTGRWSPLGACLDWSGAQRMAAWLVDATPARAGMADAAFWYAAAAKHLAPLLLAAKRGGVTMAEVVEWVNSMSFEEPLALLELYDETDGASALAACAARDERIRSSVATTLETVLSPFEDPNVAAWTSDCEIDLGRLISGGGSLYLCGPSHEQHRVQGLFAALVSAAVSEAIASSNASRRPLDPPLLVVLDEAANIAPIRDLDTLASTAAGFGIQLVTVCQDLSQLAARYGAERSRTIANNHRAKVILSGVTDLSTLDLVSGLAGEQAIREETFTDDLRDGRRTRASATVYRRLAPSDELRRIPPGDSVLVYGHLPPIRMRLRPWYSDRTLRSRAG